MHGGLNTKSICKFFSQMDAILHDESNNPKTFVIGYSNAIVTLL